MSKLFLKAKHWQLSLCSIFFCVIFMIAKSRHQFAMLNTHSTVAILFLVALLAYMETLFGWMWALSIGQQRAIPKPLRLKTGRFKTGRFKFFFATPLLGLLSALSILICNHMSFKADSTIQNSVFGTIMFFVMTLCIFGFFYCTRFAAKTYKTAVMQRKVTFGSYFGAFMGTLYFTFGIFWLQPKVNELARKAAPENTLR